MKILATLICLLVVTASFAQQNSVKEKSDSLRNRNIDNMPIREGQGNALDMPTRNGKGDAISMPNRSILVPLTPEKQVSVNLKDKGEQIKHWSVDSLNLLNLNPALSAKKK